MAFKKQSTDLNQFMHPRNIYRIKPNFRQMAKDYPEFSQCLEEAQQQFKQSHPWVFDDVVRYNYNDSTSLKVLTKILLKKDFDLDVDMPKERLIPMVPQRLNYVLWIEDLTRFVMEQSSEFIDLDNETIGVDIGTGSCCIFPLLCCSLNKNWKFLALETDVLNLEFAKRNVTQNKLEKRIEGKI